MGPQGAAAGIFLAHLPLICLLHLFLLLLRLSTFFKPVDNMRHPTHARTQARKHARTHAHTHTASERGAGCKPSTACTRELHRTPL